MPIQDYALLNIKKIKAKTLYWIIKPSDSESAINGFKHATAIGWGTSYDFNHALKYNCAAKAKHIRYSVDLNDCFGTKSTHNDFVFLSSGGFGAHKGFCDLIDIFTELNVPNTKLILTGYIGDPPISTNKNIEVFKINNRLDYLNILANADVYIMNSYSEGFGLVLLDAMINKIPWISRDIAGATDMKQYGNIYSSNQELKKLILNYKHDQNKIEAAYDYILNEKTINCMVKDFYSILN